MYKTSDHSGAHARVDSTCTCMYYISLLTCFLFKKELQSFYILEIEASLYYNSNSYDLTASKPPNITGSYDITDFITSMSRSFRYLFSQKVHQVVAGETSARITQ